MQLPAGKLPADLLARLLDSAQSKDPSVVVGAALGEDVAVVDVGGNELLVAKTDPITFAARNPGRYLMAVNANDLATAGAEPRWFLVTALLPEGIAEHEVSLLFDDLTTAAQEMNVALVGGHTEMTIGLDRPILVGCLLGTVMRDRLVRTSGAQVGDAVLLAGRVAIEGTAILASEHAVALKKKGLNSEVIDRAGKLLDQPGISVLSAAQAIHATGNAHSMHDPTEGGIVTALHELAEAAGVGLRIEREAITVLPECQAICEALGLDPLGLLASGALLAAAEPAEVTAALERLTVVGIPAAQIGEVVPASAGRTLVENGRSSPLPTFTRDELARYLETLP